MLEQEEERQVKTWHDVTQFYQRRSVKRTTSRQNLPRGDMSVSGNSDSNANNSSDDDVKDETYRPSPRAHPYGKGLASASGSKAAREEEIVEEEDGNDEANGDDGEEEETFIVDEINPSSYVHMGTPTFRLPLNPNWTEKNSYKGKTDLVREKRKENQRLVEKEYVIDYRFHTAFQQDFYEPVIITKTKHVVISQLID
jgi:hypothetical protein